MKYFYGRVPKLGNVVVSRTAIVKAEDLGLDDGAVRDLLFEPDDPDIYSDYGTVHRARGDLRAVVILRPEPFNGACLVKTILKIKPDIPTMNLKCKIDLPESIRRGIDSEETAVIDVDPAVLTQQERDILGALTMGGNFKTTHHAWPLIPEPTVKGLREVLARLATNDGSMIRRQFDCGTPETAPASFVLVGPPVVGGQILTENDPFSPWPRGNYCVWRIESVSADNRHANTVLDLPASDTFGDAAIRALRALRAGLAPTTIREGRSVGKSSSNFGSPILPACEPRLLVPIVGQHGTLQVIPLHELELHAVCLDGQPLAMHANGHSVHNLAERIVKAWETGDYSMAEEQRQYIVNCGGIAQTPEKFLYWTKTHHETPQDPCES